MPRGKSSPSSNGSKGKERLLPRRSEKDDEWGGYVPLSIDDAHRESFDLWYEEMGREFSIQLVEAVDSGLKLTISYDGANQSYIASLTGRPDISGNEPFTCCLSARAGTFEQALAVLVYKHYDMLHCDWWDLVNAPKQSRYTFG